MEPKQKLKDSDRVYATGFGPEPKLVKFLKQPVNPKTAGVAFLLTGFCVIAVSAVFVFTLFARPSKFTQTALVKPAQIQVVKTAPIVAGSQQIKWSVLINKKDLQNNEHFLKLPKGAKNIQVTPLSKKQAAAVVAQAPLNKNKCVTCNTTLAVNTIKSKSSGNNFFLGSLVSSLNSFLDYIRQFLFADLEQSASQVIEQIIPPQPEAENPVVTQASDATYVDVTSPAPAESGVSETTQTPPAEPTSSSVIPAEAGIQSESASSEENTNLDSPVPASAEGSGEAKQGNDNVNPVDEIVQVTYDTPAPTITEQTIETGKLVTISNPTETVDSPPLTDVVASTKIPEIYKVGQEDKIKIKWKNNGNQQMTFHAYDKDNNGKLDYVEWTVPHLSDQVFEIIFISKAWELNENKEIVNDIYDQVATQDQIYATVPQDHYIRATFDQILDNTKDITIYAKLAAPSSDGATAVAVEVYPVYTDADGNQTQGAKLNLVNDGQNPDFSNISADGKYRILLQNLQTPTDVFDLRVVGGTSDVPPTGIDFDYIVDPSVGSSFSNETKIGAGTTGVALNGGVTIAPCYAPNPSWTLVGTSPSTVVRDLSVTANSTTYINKDIYCDSINCILWTAGATAPGTVCISTDANVYSNLLWSKTDTSATKAWANTANSTVSIAGGDIGGTHATNKVGSGSTSIGTYKWLERYYTSTNGTAPYYPAMDACKLKGLGWRLPTILELDSIRDQTASGGIYSRLPGMTANDYWSSSGYSATSPFGLYFYSGNVDAYSAKSTANYVRCVRGY